MDTHNRNLSEKLASHIGEGRVQLILDFYAQEPQAFDAILEDNVEKEAVLAYVTDLEIRRDFFLEYQALIRKFDPLSALSEITLGIIMVAPIDQLRIRLDEMRIWSEGVNEFGFYGLLDTLRGAAAVNGIKAFVTKGGRQPSLLPTPTKRDASEAVSSRTTLSKKQRGSHTRSGSASSVPHPSTSSSNPNISMARIRSPGPLQETVGDEAGGPGYASS